MAHSPSFSVVMLKFRTDKGRDPDPQSFPEDSELLKQIRDDVLGAMEVSSDLLTDEFTRYNTPPPTRPMSFHLRREKLNLHFTLKRMATRMQSC